MVTLSDGYLGERARADHLLGAIERALSGRETPALLDYDPGSRYCIGVLTPAETEEVDAGRRARRARRKPDALGFAARVDAANGTVSGLITVRFALYLRALPDYDEQIAVAGEVEAGGKSRLRQKYRRVDVTIPDLPFSATLPSGSGISELNFAAANGLIGTHLQAVSASIAAGDGRWPGTKDFSIPNAALANEAAYRSATSGGDAVLPAWRAALDGQLVDTGDGWRLMVHLQNRSTGEAIHRNELFDVRIEVALDAGQFLSEPFVAAALDYRYRTRSWGRGDNAVLVVDDEGRVARTESLPVYEQPRTKSAGASDSCRTEILAGPEVLEALGRIASQLDAYGEDWATTNDAYAGDPSHTARAADLARFRGEIERFRFGVAALRDDARLLRAFRLANLAAQRRGLASWRLFQVVFMVIVAPSLLARERPDDKALRAELEAVDVLWFPTGGGKTEAYFGVILIAMFFDRLRGKSRGTTAWLRYPLRMLSVQQLQRLVEFVVSAEAVRVEVLGADGGDTFAVGYYVGSQNTPNELTGAFKPYRIDVLAKQARENGGDVADLHVLQRCPYCGTTSPRIEVDASPAVLRLRHRCRSADCGKVAPIYLSDGEIYRYAPTVLVGTVDRLARAGQTDLFAHLFGQVEAICPHHGYTSYGECVEGACAVNKKAFNPIPPIHDPTPALLLQDELHLLKESLGTYDAHFEGFLDAAAAHLGTGLPSKRLAATATIEGFAKHVSALYGREARRFPEKGRGEFDSAYALLNEESPVARLYLGILPLGIDSDEVAARVAEVIEAEAGRYWADPAHDPVLAGRYDLSLIYVNQKNTAGNIGARLNSLWVVRTLTGDRSLDEVRQAIDDIEGDDAKPYAERLKTLIATSLISHGVDLRRLNAMAFVGFPGRAADYIQSSSRVGRENVGLVCTIFDPNATLDRSTYLHFHEYHERLYQLVQPVPINRFSESSVSRTFTGIYSALILNVVAPLKKRAGITKGSLRRGQALLQAYAKGSITDDEMVDLLVESYGIERHGLPTEVSGKLRTLIGRKVKLARQDIETGEDYATYQRLKPPPVSSLREVQEQVEFKAEFRMREEIDRVRGY